MVTENDDLVYSGLNYMNFIPDEIAGPSSVLSAIDLKNVGDGPSSALVENLVQKSGSQKFNVVLECAGRSKLSLVVAERAELSSVLAEDLVCRRKNAKIC